MAAKGKRPRSTTSSVSGETSARTTPAFPYSNKPNSLRKFLELVPEKPRPSKINAETLKAWGLRDTNDASIIRVLKALGFVSASNEPTDKYTEFMSPGTGPATLAAAIRTVWAPLFEHSHEPHREDDTTLRRYFNIHSGGSESTISHQIQTFKAACDHAEFGATTGPKPADGIPGPIAAASGSGTPSGGSPTIHIDLHIHLPENKSRRDYEAIFEDIARSIFGREIGGRRAD